MKVKELQKTVNVAWSPGQQSPIYLAAGTSAQQLDASFSTNASLELYALNLADPGYEMELRGNVASAHRFNKVVWSHHGFGGTHPNGLIVGACENGVVQLYSASKLLAHEDCLLGQAGKHNGSVLAVDFNPFQANLLATGASESEIFIWDLNNIASPMTPGTKVTPNEDVLSVHWNKQVQHILASVFASKCVIWDLRKNEPIIKLHDTQSRVRWRAAQWNPEVATQIWLASEEDSVPSVQLWDLRYATAPSKSFQIHQRGVLGLSWCQRDMDLMISCGKDNRILCWNPNTENQDGEILSEIATTTQWCFDVSWCPRNPALVAGCTFDGTVSVYSLFGGSVIQAQTTSKIADSFPGMDNLQAAPVPQTNVPTVSHDLKKPPKWLRRPAGAVFGFGGKLISFNNKENSRQITISQVVTDTELVERATKLEASLAQGDFAEYCRQKADQSTDQHTRYLWYFIKSNFEANPRSEMLNLLGYQPEEIAQKFSEYIKKDDGINSLSNQIENTSLNGSGPFDAISDTSKADEPFILRTGVDADGRTNPDGLICEALLTGNIEAAVDLCMSAGRSTHAIILAMTGGSELLARTQYRYLRDDKSYISSVISALVTRDWTDVINRCSVTSWKEALVAVLTHSQDPAELCQRLAEKLRIEGRGDLALTQNAILCAICSGNLEQLVEAWSSVQDSPQASPTKGGKSKNIQELVEILMVMQKALERQGKPVDATGKVAEILSKYATLLATQGSLATALNYLGPSLDPELVDLKDRLYYALGHKKAPAFTAPQTTSRYSRSSISSQVPLQQPAAPATNMFAPPPSQSTWTPAATNVFNPNPSIYSPAQPTFTPAPAPYNPGPPPAASSLFTPAAAPAVTAPPTAADSVQSPQRPPSVNSGGPLSRKYLLDPSVRSGYGQVPQSSAIFQPQDYTSSPFAGPIPPTPQFNQFNTTPFGATQQQQAPPEIGQPAMPMKNPTPPPGWNDPPPVRTTRNRPSQPKIEPLTQPFYGQDPNTQQQQPGILNPLQPTNGFHQDPNSGIMSGYGSEQQPQVFQPFTPAQPVMGGPPGNAAIPAAGAGGNFMHPTFHPQPGPAANQPAVRQTPEPPKAKAPLPEEFIYLQTVLEELRTQCIQAATNPQTKRKLEDVAKRLEHLYDLLRENRLSPNTLASLNQLVQLIQIGDYGNGLGLHTQMAQSPDFSQIASFMPGVKVLLQSAMQLQVYLR